MQDATKSYVALAKDDKATRSLQLEKKLREEDVLKKEFDRLVLQKTMIQEHKKRAEEECKKLHSESVKLNVRGKIFQLSMNTIMKYPRSTLALMFSGKWHNKKDESGAVFIDRDPQLFAHIVQWMRTKHITIGVHSELFEPLLQEIDYFGLDEMKRQLLGFTCEVIFTEEYEASWPEDWLEMKKKEDHWRDVFVNDRQNPTLDNPYLDLISVFDNLDQFYEQNDKNLPQVFKQAKVLSPLNRSIVSDFHDFQKRFDLFTCGQLANINWNNVIVAGGAVLAALMPLPPSITQEDEVFSYYHGGFTGDQVKKFSNGFWGSSDIDIFLYGLTPEQANQKVVEIFNAMDASKQPWTFQTTNAVTIITGGWPRRYIQIILRIYKSPAEVLMGFDVDSCCVAYDGTKVWTTPRGQRALNYRMNVADPTRQSPSYEFRLYKYSKRGFSVGVPGLNELNINKSIFTKTLKSATGLARLLLLEKRSVSELVPCVCNAKVEYPKENVRHFTDCPLHKGRRQQAATRIANVEDRIESELLAPISVTDYASTFLPYGAGWGNIKLNKLLNERYWNASEPISWSWGGVDGFEAEWMTENPGTQLTGKSKPFIAKWHLGSFNPIHRDWFKQAYSKSDLV